MDTVRVKMKTLSAGPNGVMREGGEYEVPADQAKALIDGHYAEACGEPSRPHKGEPVETATPDRAPETAAKHTEPPHKGGKPSRPHKG